MATLELFEGIKINVYNGEHRPPHFHALYAEYEAAILIDSGDIIAGKLPVKQTKKILKWLENNSKWVENVFFEMNPNLK